MGEKTGQASGDQIRRGTSYITPKAMGSLEAPPDMMKGILKQKHCLADHVDGGWDAETGAGRPAEKMIILSILSGTLLEKYLKSCIYSKTSSKY